MGQLMSVQGRVVSAQGSVVSASAGQSGGITDFSGKMMGDGQVYSPSQKLSLQFHSQFEVLAII